MQTKFTLGRKLFHALTVAFLFCAFQSKAATITANGSTTICPGDSVTLTASNGDSYQWFNFGFPIFGAMSQSYVAKQTGQFTVVVTTGLIPSTSNMVQVTISSFPNVTINSSAANLCPGDGLSMIVNTSNNGGNAASFNSLLNTNAIVTIPHHAQLIPAALTIEIWARPQLNLGSAALISKLPSSSSTQVGYAIKQAGNT